MVGVGAGVKCFKDLPVGAKSVLFSMMWPTSFLIIISGFLHPSEIQKSHCSIFLRVLWANLRKDSRPNYPRRPRPPIAPSSHFISPWHNRSNSESTVITDMGESKTALTEGILCLIKTWIVLLRCLGGLGSDPLLLHFISADQTLKALVITDMTGGSETGV